MYPDFQHLLQSLLGTEVPEWLSIFKTFGFFVAMAFLAAAWTLKKELQRKEAMGLLQPVIVRTETGKPATSLDYILSAITGFLLGFKIVGIFGRVAEVSPDPLGYIFSTKGSIWGGIIGLIVLIFLKYREKKAQELPEPKIVERNVYPHERVLEILLVAAVSGMIGAKVFNAFETWQDFLRDPIGNLFSSAGLTFYGGLIVASVTLYYYSRKNKIDFRHLCDAVAPGLLLAYAVGRLGCHFAGDGDWGIFNSAYITATDGSLQAIAANEFEQLTAGIADKYAELKTIPHIYAPAPNWLPDWLFGMNYPNNVNNEGVYLAGCQGSYCAVLPVSVFPTPIYEFITCTILFVILWVLRKKLKFPLQLFGAYLIMNGLERFFVEKIRVNYKYDWGFIQPTQAEIISTVLVITGLVLLFALKKKQKTV